MAEHLASVIAGLPLWLPFYAQDFAPVLAAPTIDWIFQESFSNGKRAFILPLTGDA